MYDMRDVETLHLLIHPGFIAETVDRSLTPPQDRLDPGQTLFLRYSEYIDTLTVDDFLWFLLHKSGNMMFAESHAGLQYPKQLIALHRQVRERTVGILQIGSVFSDDDIARTVEGAKKITAQRGFRITPNTRSVAFGETLQCCVVEIAERVNKIMGVVTKTEIIPELCDIDIPGGTNSAELQIEIPNLEVLHPHILIRKSQ
jgi:hypothetical protein